MLGGFTRHGLINYVRIVTFTFTFTLKCHHGKTHSHRPRGDPSWGAQGGYVRIVGSSWPPHFTCTRTVYKVRIVLENFSRVIVQIGCRIIHTIRADGKHAMWQFTSRKFSHRQLLFQT